MEKRRVRLEINGVVLGVITEESDEYMEALAEEVGDQMQAILDASPFITREAAALTAALGYLDDAKKAEDLALQHMLRADELAAKRQEPAPAPATPAAPSAAEAAPEDPSAEPETQESAPAKPPKKKRKNPMRQEPEMEQTGLLEFFEVKKP